MSGSTHTAAHEQPGLRETGRRSLSPVLDIPEATPCLQSSLETLAALSERGEKRLGPAGEPQRGESKWEKDGDTLGVMAHELVSTAVPKH